MKKIGYVKPRAVVQMIACKSINTCIASNREHLDQTDRRNEDHVHDSYEKLFEGLFKLSAPIIL